MSDTQPLPTNAALLVRLRFIDFLLNHYGSINRDALVDYFGISSPQATRDIKAYKEVAPDNMHFDDSSKRYYRSLPYKRVFP